MKCLMCGKRMKKNKETYHYLSSGLKRVYLQNIEILKCSSCEEEEVVIPNIENLHSLIVKIIASQKQKLLPEEIRFLRTFLGFSGSDFANKIGVSPETVSRWEKGKVSMKPTVERLLRVLILSNKGPFRDYEELSDFGTQNSRISKKIICISKKNNWIQDIAA